MPDTYSVLAQSAPGAAALTDAYTVPASTEAIVSSITAANRSATPTAIRIAVAPAGGGISNEMYIAYDIPIGANELIALTLGITLAATDVIRVYNTLATVSFNIFGVEKT